MVKSKLLFVSTWYPANVDWWLSTAFEDYGYEVVRVGKTYFNQDNCGLGILLDEFINKQIFG